MKTAFAKSFDAALARLEPDEQLRAKGTVYDFRRDPSRPAFKFHALAASANRDLWSVRVNDDLRIIVHRQGDVAVFVHVDHHDAAYRWAERRRFIPNAVTGALQMVEVEEVVEHVTRQVVRTELLEPRLFEHQDPAYLASLGVPEPWLDAVRRVGQTGLLELIDHLPEEAMERLMTLATGGLVTPPEPLAPGQDALTHPDARRRFTLVADDEQLRRMLEQPLATWLVFLHPSQRAAVERDYRGPARVSGGAGTGKTVVALHRAAWLAGRRDAPPGLPDAAAAPAETRTADDARVSATPRPRAGAAERTVPVLLTTYTRTLAARLAEQLDQLLGADSLERARVAVRNLHSVAYEIVERDLGRPPTILDRRELDRRLEPAWRASGLDEPLAFLRSEFAQVIEPQGIDSATAYVLASREGAGRALQQVERLRLWRVFGPLQRELRQAGIYSWDGLCHRAATLLDSEARRPFEHVVVDETQDLGPAELAFVRALVERGANDVFLCGDAGQRIYRNRSSFASHGLEVRGRATILRLNYRTTEQIRRFADTLPNGVPEAEDRRNVSLLRGPVPRVMGASDVQDEVERVAERLRKWLADGMAPGDVALFARTRALLHERAVPAARLAGLATYELNEEATADTARVAVGTMHSAKGLEFRAVVVVGADADQLPLRVTMNGFAAERARSAFEERERNLLYVACTRAREELLVTHIGLGSAYLRAVAGSAADSAEVQARAGAGGSEGPA